MNNIRRLEAAQKPRTLTVVPNHPDEHVLDHQSRI